MQVVDTWFEYHQLRDAGIPVRHFTQKPVQTLVPEEMAPVNQTHIEIPPLPRERSTPGGDDMDLGTLATDLLKSAGEAYIRKEFAPEVAVSTGYAPSVQQFTKNSFEPDLPVIDIVREGTCNAGCVKRRRRRRALVTCSEISQLASLKAVASPSEVKLFLAKRLRC